MGYELVHKTSTDEDNCKKNINIQTSKLLR